MARRLGVKRAAYASSAIVLSSPPFQQQSKVNRLESQAHWALIRDIEIDVGGAARSVFSSVSRSSCWSLVGHVKCRI